MSAVDPRLLRNRPAFTLDRDTAPAMWLVETLWLIQATGVQTGNRCSFLEQVMPNGIGPPAHRHPLSIEGFYVVEGTMEFHLRGRTTRAEAGTVVHVPRCLAHTFTVDTEEARVLNWYAPAGNEIQVMSLARPADERRRPTMAEGPAPNTDELNRILSRLYGAVAVDALPFSTPPSEELLTTPEGDRGIGEPLIVRADRESTFERFGLTWRLLAAGSETADEYDLFEVSAPPGSGMPTRRLGADEVLYVLEGSVVVETDGETARTEVGALTYAPAGTVVRWRADDAARLLVFHFPGGFDRAIGDADGDDARAIAAMEAAGTRLISLGIGGTT